MTAPVVVVGRVNTEASDYYKVTATAGQRISFEVLAGAWSAFDPQLTLFDAKTGRELPGGTVTTPPACKPIRASPTFSRWRAITWSSIRDVSYRGGEDFSYRLRIGDFPAATTTLPMAAEGAAAR